MMRYIFYLMPFSWQYRYAYKNRCGLLNKRKWIIPWAVATGEKMSEDPVIWERLRALPTNKEFIWRL